MKRRSLPAVLASTLLLVATPMALADVFWLDAGAMRSAAQGDLPNAGYKL